MRQHFLYNSTVSPPINLSTPLKIIYLCSKMFDTFMYLWIWGEMVFLSKFSCQRLLCAESSVAHKYDLCFIQKPASNLPLMGHYEPNENIFAHMNWWTASWYFRIVDWWTYGHYKRQFMHHNSSCTAVITKISFWEKTAFENMLIFWFSMFSVLWLLIWIDIFYSFLCNTIRF